MVTPTFADSTDGVSLALYDLGGDGPAVIFAHATGFCAETWIPVADSLENAHSWALDFRAHGRSTRPSHGGLAWEGVGADVLAAVDHLGLDQPFGVGHSMGGAALVLAEIARPGTLSGIWMFEPTVIPPGFFPDEPGSNFLSVSAARRRPTFESMAAARSNFSGKPPMDGFDPRSLEGYLNGGFEPLPDGSVALRCAREDESQFYLMASMHGAWDRLGEIDVPTWIARGADDGTGPATFAPQVAARIAGATLIEHPELGHFGPMEQPELLAAEIDRARSAV